MCKETPIRLSADSVTETVQARREWHNIFKVMKRKNLTTKNIPPGKVIIQNWKRDKSFTDKQKLKSLVSLNWLYKKM